MNWRLPGSRLRNRIIMSVINAEEDEEHAVGLGRGPTDYLRVPQP